MQTPSKLGAFSLLAIACLTIMVGCVIVPGLPSIAKNLGTESTAGLLVTIPSLGVVLFGPLAGRFIDKVGLYKAVCIGLFLYGLLGAGGAFLHGEVIVFADRLLLGGATALVMAGGTGLISAFYHGKARLQMIASQGMSIELGGVIFLFLGGLLATAGWRWPFVLYLASWVMLLMVLVFVPRPTGEQPEEAEETTKKPVPRALKEVYAAAVFSMLAFFTAIIMLPLKLNAMGLTEAETGYFLAFVSLVAVAAAALMPTLVSRLREHGTLSLAFVAYAAAHALFAFAPSLEYFVVGAVFMGAGFGFSVPLVNHMTVEQSHAQVRGRNLAYLSMAIFSGQFLCSAIELAPSGNETLIFGISCALAIAAAIWLACKRVNRRQHHFAS
ncbi:MFS transporter [Pseudomonas nabeulensis]|uniref:MFS transporter n=1 Tax=Pseudomonas nabeulensis TaxID=2293833 RepID=A0A4Z0AMT5_9PSED|nr:MFS transporter [Pseudomonas nabeulensis]TFY87707.1 MFS transporter [Pseudomonas nabeulensis]